ncbi:hypothetical protein Aperf_G00000101875 [Anoplocephala perfoliata]
MLKCPHFTDFWKICQIFFAEVLAGGLANFFCFLLDTREPNFPLTAGILAGGSAYVAIWCTFTTSGAQINSAVTLYALITRRMPLYLAPVYLIADFLGTLLGMTMAWSVSPFADQNPGKYGMTLPADGVSDLAATMTEAGITFILIMVIQASMDELRAREWRPEHGAPFPLAIMITLVINITTTARITGASLNPTRSLAAAIIQNNYDRIWIYFAGPILGCLVACFFYELVICPFASLNRTRHFLCSRNFDRKFTYNSTDPESWRN